MTTKLQDIIFEGIRRESVLIDGQEVPFGHGTHVADMERTLAGLERVRDCYAKGSGHRLVYAHAVARLRKLINDLAAKQENAPRSTEPSHTPTDQ